MAFLRAFSLGLTLRYFILLCLTKSILALKHNFVVNQDARTLIAPIGTPYGFVEAGCFGFDVFDFNLEVGHRHKRVKQKKSNPPPQPQDNRDKVLNHVEAGFLLKRFPSESSFAKFLEEYMSNSTRCVYEYFQKYDDSNEFGENDDMSFDVKEIDTAATEGIFLPVRYANSTWSSSTASVLYEFKKGEEGLYFLMYQVCADSREVAMTEIRSTFELDFHYKNIDNLGMDSYLTAGELPLPTIFLYFFISYAISSIIWVLNIRGIQRGREGCFEKSGDRPKIYQIHHLMSVLIVLKTLSVLFESIRYHYIRLTGHAKVWTVVYYTLACLKGIFLFTVILLIGSGWSFVKPFLADREKKIIFAVLSLQVIDNIALVVLSQETEGESVYDDWSAILHIVDIVCCCIVLIPIVWQVNNLEKTLESQGVDEEGRELPPVSIETARTLSRLKMFRGFYMLVVAYIYFTRIAVYLFATTLDYKYTWVRYFVTELATLAFYIVVGFQFRPLTENIYVPIAKDGEGSADEVEMATQRSTRSKK